MPTRLALADAVVQAAHANLLNALDTGVRVEAARMIHNTAVEELNRIQPRWPSGWAGRSAPSDPARRPPFQPLAPGARPTQRATERCRALGMLDEDDLLMSGLPLSCGHVVGDLGGAQLASTLMDGRIEFVKLQLGDDG